MFFSALLQAEIGPAALNLTDSSLGSNNGGGGGGSSSGSGGSSHGNAAKTPSAGGAPSHSGGAPPGGRRPAFPSSPASKPSSKATPGRAKSTWRVEDLEGEIERKIKMLEKERQSIRKETQSQHEKINHGLDSVNQRVTELEHSESSTGLSMAGGGDGGCVIKNKIPNSIFYLRSSSFLISVVVYSLLRKQCGP